MGFKVSKNTKIFIAGHTGLVGSAFVRYFEKKAFKNIFIIPREKLDLTDFKSVDKYLFDIKPELVILAAGKTGGILENINNPLSLMLENLEIQTNVLHASMKHKVDRLLFFGSTCMYPSNSMVLLKEEMLFTGKPEISSLSYAVAKLSGLQLCLAYNLSMNKNMFLPIIPNSIYGPNDNFDHMTGHVLSSLISKFYLSKINNKKELILWGSGKPKREFIYVDDLVDACILILKNSDQIKFPINISSGEELTIKKLANMIKKVIDFKGNILWDKTKPDGVIRKRLNIKKIKKIGWNPKIDISKGLNKSYEWFKKNVNNQNF